MDIITLRAGEASVELAPAAGGAITRYWHERAGVTREWLRPPPPDPIRGVSSAAAFPLGPTPIASETAASRFAGAACSCR